MFVGLLAVFNPDGGEEIDVVTDQEKPDVVFLSSTASVSLRLCFFPQSHLTVCTYNVVPCPNRCMLKLLRRDLPQHMQHDCTKRKLRCDHCAEEFTGEAHEVRAYRHVHTLPDDQSRRKCFSELIFMETVCKCAARISAFVFSVNETS